MRIIGILILLTGTALLAWSAVVGLSFCGIYLMGFIGTSGREAGGELALMLLLTSLGMGGGFLIAWLGRTLIRHKKPDKPS